MRSGRTYEPYLAVLRAQPFVDSATVVTEVSRRDSGADGLLVLATPSGPVELPIEVRGRVGPPVEAMLLELARRTSTPWILFCAQLPPASARRLADAGVNYVDAAGNCHLVLGRRYVAHVEGRKPERRTSQGRGRPGRTEYVLLALFLSQPETAGLKLRELKELTGVSPTSLSYALNSLRRRGLLRASGSLHLPAAIERWIVGYADVLRPALERSRFAYRDAEPSAFEARAEQLLDDAGIDYAWTGGAAAWRYMRYWHGERTVLHTDAPMEKLARLLKLVPKEDGPLVVLGAPGPFVYAGTAPRLAPLPLVYAELLADGDERARDAARRLREQHLAEWPP